MRTSAIYSRTKSTYPISIGTSLALETITQHTTEKDREIPGLSGTPSAYAVFAISINTLLHSMINAIEEDISSAVITPELSSVLIQNIIEELNIIEEIVSVYHMQVHPYVNSFKSAKLIGKELGNLRSFSGKRLKTEQLVHSGVMEAIAQGYTTYDSVTKLSLTRPGSRVLALTSFPMDLIGNERAVSLLQPHTGVVLERDLFFRKFYPLPKTDIDMIPFNRTTHMLFGDKYIYKPISLKLRKQIVSIGLDKGWNYNTARSKVIFDILESADEELKEIIHKIRRI